MKRNNYFNTFDPSNMSIFMSILVLLLSFALAFFGGGLILWLGWKVIAVNTLQIVNAELMTFWHCGFAAVCIWLSKVFTTPNRN